MHSLNILDSQFRCPPLSVRLSTEKSWRIGTMLSYRIASNVPIVCGRRKWRCALLLFGVNHEWIANAIRYSYSAYHSMVFAHDCSLFSFAVAMTFGLFSIRTAAIKLSALLHEQTTSSVFIIIHRLWPMNALGNEWRIITFWSYQPNIHHCLRSFYFVLIKLWPLRARS